MQIFVCVSESMTEVTKGENQTDIEESADVKVTMLTDYVG